MNWLSLLSRARTHLFLDAPWFGSLSMRMTWREGECEDFKNDGTYLTVNPEFIRSLNDSERKTVLAFAALQNGLLHPYRSQGRERESWNQASQYVVNGLLRQEGYLLPKGALHDPKYDNLSVEQVYARLAEDRRNEPDSPGPGRGLGEMTAPAAPTPGDDPADPHRLGEEESEERDPLSAQDWEIAAEQAMAVARKAGRMPGGVARFVQDTHQEKADWREILRRFVEQVIPRDYSWATPNKRFLWQGLYLPGVEKKNTPRLVVAIDTSGSIHQKLLDLFAHELTGILFEARPESIDVLYCDTQVQATQTFAPDDGEVKLQAKGGGGTLFQPVFDFVEEQEARPAALIYFTDLESFDDPKEPEYPVLWITTMSSDLEGPFGETIRLDEWSQ